jgi:hypothetical protein
MVGLSFLGGEYSISCFRIFTASPCHKGTKKAWLKSRHFFSAFSIITKKDAESRHKNKVHKIKFYIYVPQSTRNYFGLKTRKMQNKKQASRKASCLFGRFL